MNILFQKLNTAMHMPPKVLVKILLIIAKQKTRRYVIKLFPVKISDKDFLKAIGYDSTDKFLNRKLPPFFFDPNDKEKIVEIIKIEYPTSIKETINDADEICEHIFDLLGSGKTKLGREIDWHLDFKSGFRWNPKEYYVKTEKPVDCYLKKGIYADVNVPWKLSRCQHFIALGKAYWYTGNEKYAKEFVNQIESWISRNSVEFGVNWASIMDVAIRALNWIWSYYFFCNSKTLTKEFKIKFFKSLFLHGRHIINNLEWGWLIRSNHYLLDIGGLIYLGTFFPECKDTKKWLKKGLSALKEDMELQVHPDGVDFEASIGYHRLITELFLSSVLLCKINNITIPDEVLARLKNMIDFTMYYTKPDGMCPVIGDADDGRLHILADNSINDHRYLLSAGAVLFNESDFKSPYPVFNEEAFWLLGIEGLSKFEKMPDKKFKLTSKAFREGGYYIMRNDDLYMIVRCGDIGLKGCSGHGHCDCLSFELFAHDKAFIIDPGAYVYTADKDMRNLFRSTKYHNTIVVDDEEMNRFDEDLLFSMQFDAVPKINKWEVTKKYDFFDGEHSGYERLPNPVTHRRQIYFNKEEEYWVIRDLLTGEGVHKFDLYFHFAPMKIEKDSKDQLTVRTKVGESNISLIPLEMKNLNMEIQKGWMSYSYGRKVEAPIVKYTKTTQVPTEFVTLICTTTKEEIKLRKVKEKFSRVVDKG